MIVIVSKDKDFSGILASHIERELKLPCKVVADTKAAAALVNEMQVIVIAHEKQHLPQDVPQLVIQPAGTLPVEGALAAPVKLQEVLAKLAQMRQNPGAGEPLTLAGGYVFSPKQKKLTRGETALDLTDKEAQLLQALIGAGEAGISKESLLKNVWGFEADMNTHTLETHIYRLREKFRELGEREVLVASDGGYRLV